MNLKEEFLKRAITSNEDLNSWIDVVDTYITRDENKEYIIRGFDLGESLFSKVFFAGYI